MSAKVFWGLIAFWFALWAAIAAQLYRTIYLIVETLK